MRPCISFTDTNCILRSPVAASQPLEIQFRVARNHRHRNAVMVPAGDQGFEYLFRG